MTWGIVLSGAIGGVGSALLAVGLLLYLDRRDKRK